MASLIKTVLTEAIPVGPAQAPKLASSAPSQSILLTEAQSPNAFTSMKPDMPPAKFRIAICGGGVGGLTFAVALAKYPDIQLEIYEAAQEFSAIGAGIGVWPRVWDVLCKMGLDDLGAHAASPPTKEEVHAFRFRKSDQAEGLEYHDMYTKGRLLTFHRADFQRFLVDKLPSWTRVHHSMRLQSYTQQASGEINLLFDNGSTATCDVLIGADGIRSAVRSSLLDHQVQQAIADGNTKHAHELLSSVAPVWSGSLAYRSLIPVARLEDAVKRGVLKVPTFPVEYTGKKATMIAYPVANGRFFNVTGYSINPKAASTVFDGPWVALVEKDEVVSVFRDWEPEVRAWLDCMDLPTRWATHVVKPFDCYVSGGVALIGDAAHGMTPHLGSGAGQAIEDAYFLATLLGHRATTKETLPRALSIYDSVRRPFAVDIARRSELNGRLLTLDVEGVEFDDCSVDERQARLKDLGHAIVENWEWAWTTTLDGQLNEAIEVLEKGVV